MLTATNDLENAKSEAYDLLDKGKKKAHEAKNEIKNEGEELKDKEKRKQRR